MYKPRFSLNVLWDSQICITSRIPQIFRETVVSRERERNLPPSRRDINRYVLTKGEITAKIFRIYLSLIVISGVSECKCIEHHLDATLCHEV